MTLSRPGSSTLKRYELASLLLVLAPLSGGFGLWLIFPSLQIKGNACLSCFPTIDVSSAMSSSLVTQFVIGVFLFLAAVLFFVSSLGAFASNTNTRAMRWFRWLGKLTPKIDDETPVGQMNSKYRGYTRLLLLVILAQAILLIPGIGEDRTYALTQFSTLFLGPVWYSYTVAILVSSFILISYRRPGGYILGIMVSLIGVGTTVPDVFGLLPPSAPTLRTTILALSVLPLASLLAYFSWREFRLEVIGKF